MSMRTILCTAAVALGALVVPATAEATNLGGSTNSGGTNTNTPKTTTITRTFLFPAVGLASSESARIAVVNIAQASHKGTAAACSGTISFTDLAAAPVGKATAFTNVGTGQIAHGDVSGFSLGGGRNEYQGSVQVTVDPASGAPCSLLLTLEVFDTTTGVTHAVVTSAIEGPVAVEPMGVGRGH